MQSRMTGGKGSGEISALPISAFPLLLLQPSQEANCRLKSSGGTFLFLLYFSFLPSFHIARQRKHIEVKEFPKVSAS